MCHTFLAPRLGPSTPPQVAGWVGRNLDSRSGLPFSAGLTLNGLDDLGFTDRQRLRFETLQPPGKGFAHHDVLFASTPQYSSKCCFISSACFGVGGFQFGSARSRAAIRLMCAMNRSLAPDVSLAASDSEHRCSKLLKPPEGCFHGLYPPHGCVEPEMQNSPPHISSPRGTPRLSCARSRSGLAPSNKGRTADPNIRATSASAAPCRPDR